MKYIDKYLEYLKIERKYSDKTILSYKDDLIEYNEFLGNNFTNICITSPSLLKIEPHKFQKLLSPILDVY